MKKGESILLNKYDGDNLLLPSVVDVMDFENHIALDIVHLHGEQFRKDQLLTYLDKSFIVVKKIKDYPIQTMAKIENRNMIRKCRYF